MVLSNCCHGENAYVGGGGLNVRDIFESSVSIFYPVGCVLELLEAFLGRAASLESRTTVISFLRVSRVLEFGIRGHLFEWLIAHDITCRSEFNRIMPFQAKRHDVCIAATPGSDPEVYNRIVADASVDGG